MKLSSSSGAGSVETSSPSHSRHSFRSPSDSPSLSSSHSSSGLPIGGQAVIEGVMMRNKEKYSVAVRLPSGKINVKTKQSSPFPQLFNVIFIRGMVGLGYMLKDGLDALVWSSNQQLGTDEQLSTKELFFTLSISFCFALLFFVGLPFLTAHLILVKGIWFDLLDGLFRIIVFVSYLLIISRMNDMKTLFEYHGAEHKTIYCYEAQRPLTIDNVRIFPRQHHRCGTSFLFLVVVISIILFSLVSLLSSLWWVKLSSRILLLPVIAGISYELLKLGDKFQHHRVFKLFLLPGLWLQKITTKEPSDKQIEVAMKALQGVVR